MVMDNRLTEVPPITCRVSPCEGGCSLVTSVGCSDEDPDPGTELLSSHEPPLGRPQSHRPGYKKLSSHSSKYDFYTGMNRYCPLLD